MTCSEQAKRVSARVISLRAGETLADESARAHAVGGLAALERLCTSASVEFDAERWREAKPLFDMLAAVLHWIAHGQLSPDVDAWKLMDPFHRLPNILASPSRAVGDATADVRRRMLFHGILGEGDALSIEHLKQTFIDRGHLTAD